MGGWVGAREGGRQGRRGAGGLAAMQEAAAGGYRHLPYPIQHVQQPPLATSSSPTCRCAGDGTTHFC